VADVDIDSDSSRCRQGAPAGSWPHALLGSRGRDLGICINRPCASGSPCIAMLLLLVLLTPRPSCTQDSFRTIVRTEGVATLWRGLLPTLVMTVPATALYFATYEKAKQTLHSRFESPFLRAISIPASGSHARTHTHALSLLIISPVCSRWPAQLMLCRGRLATQACLLVSLPSSSRVRSSSSAQTFKPIERAPSLRVRDALPRSLPMACH